MVMNLPGKIVSSLPPSKNVPHSYFASLHFLLILLPESKVCFTKFPVSPFVPEIEAKSRFYCSTPVTLRALVVKRAKRRLY